MQDVAPIDFSEPSLYITAHADERVGTPRVVGLEEWRSRVAECCVVGRPDDRLGEVVVAFVQPADGAQLAADELLARCRSNLASYKVPSEICFVEAFPRSPLGKIARSQVQTMAQG
ncbi:MAG: hypothetical protein OXG34_13320 [bacterium]|nr:hypothetical protein [bacterium]MCY4134129.1 hypothetical protein [bacterium]